MAGLATALTADGRDAAGRDALGGNTPSRAGGAFAAAEAHSRRVRLLRRIIPVVAGLAVLIAVAGPLLNPFRAIDGNISIGSVALQGTKITMEAPKLSGFRKDAKAYEVIADSAAQDIRKPSIVELTQPVARIEMDRNSWARLSADTGVYDSTTEKLVVTDKVKVKTENGYEMRLRQANVDFKAGTVVSEQPVEVDLPSGWVTADRMNIFDNGKSVVFEGNVRSEFRDTTPEDKSQDGKKP